MPRVPRAAAGAGLFEAGRTLREELGADATVAAGLSVAELDHALDSARYLGCAEQLIERALELHRRQRAAG